jgi:hypothetical protein
VRQAVRIIDATADHEERIEMFDALARERLIVDGKAQTDLAQLDKRIVQTVREIVQLSDGIAVSSWHDHSRLELSFGFTAEPYFVIPEPDREIPSFERAAEPDAIVVWAPSERADELALIAFALEDLRYPAFVVCAAGGRKPPLRAQFVEYDRAAEVLSRARAVIDPSRHPANALALAAQGVPLAVSLSSGAYELLDDVTVFVPWDRADVLRAAHGALAGKPACPRDVPGRIAADATVDESLPTDGPLVSIVVRTFNRPAYLERALRSLERQEYRNIEAVVVSDAGVDVSEIVARFPQARLIVHDEHRGAVPACNTGLRESRGEFVGLLDDDDILFPDHVSSLVAVLQHSGGDVAHADTISAFYDTRVDDETPYGYSIFLDKLGEPTDLHIVDGIGPMAALFRRSLALELGGYDESLPHAEDWDMWIRLAQRSDFVHVKRVTALYSIRNDGMNLMISNREGFIRATHLIAEKSPLEGRDALAAVRAGTNERFLATGAEPRFPQPALERR